jgi:glutamyl-tRNA synthetase
VAWLSVRAGGGTFVLRIEDLDRQRYRPELVPAILDDLRWLGLDWDEGPDRSGPHAPYVQWDRRERYLEALARLQQDERVYPCFCSRRDVAAAASAPQEPGEEQRYPGTCRGIDPAEAGRRIAAGERHSWRFEVRRDAAPGFLDRVRGRWPPRPRPAPGDFVVHRADGVPAYHLAVVVDDAAMGIDEVVRGDDLLESTLRHLLLFDALGLATPSFAHVPLLLGADGVRLSKRHRGTALVELRREGARPQDVVGRLAAWLGLRPDPAPVSAAELVTGFDLTALPPAPEGIRIGSQ